MITVDVPELRAACRHFVESFSSYPNEEAFTAAAFAPAEAIAANSIVVYFIVLSQYYS
jgi:hypothetical protein